MRIAYGLQADNRSKDRAHSLLFEKVSMNNRDTPVIPLFPSSKPSRRFPICFIWLIIGVSAFIGLLQPATVDGKALEKIAIQLRWHHQFQFAGYYAAVEKGFYRKAGFQVELLEAEPDNDTVAAVLSGKAQYGVSNSEILQHYLNGEPLVAMAAIFQHSPLVLVTRADSGITSAKELVGKRVLMSSAGRDIELQAMLHNAGISLDQIELVEGIASPETYFDPNIDAISAYTTNELYYYQQRKIRYRVIAPITYNVDFYGDCLFTTQSEVDQHPHRALMIRDATLRGWRYALKHPQEIIDLISQRYGSKKTKAHMSFEAAAVKLLIRPELIQLGHMNPDRWQHIADTFIRFKMANPGPALANFLYQPPESERVRQIRTTALVLAAVLFAAILLFVILFLFTKKLHKEVVHRKAAQSALAVAEKEKTTVLNSMKEIVVYLDPDHHIRWANESAAQRLGLTTQALQGRHCSIIWEHCKQHCQTCPVTRAIERGTEQHGRIISEEGQTWLFHAYPVHDKLDKLAGVVNLASDVTESQKLESERLRIQKLESIGVLAGGIAHDFNNVLTAVIGYIELTRIEMRPGDQGLHFLGEAEKASQRAKELAHMLLTFSKGGEPIKRKGAIVPVLRQAIEHANVGQTIDCSLQISENILPVAMDAAQIENAIRNVLINAQEAMPDGGTITITVANTSFENQTSQDLSSQPYVKITIIDQGYGIVEDHLENIFDPYFTTKQMSVQKGMGLGLSITHSIIRKHEGFIKVDSALGKGTAISIFLPAASPCSDKSNRFSEVIEGETASMGKILLMDDEKIIWDVAGQLLQHLGYKTEFAVNGEEALARYKDALTSEEPFQAVILDLTIKGGMGGREALIKLRKIDPNVKAFVSSGYSDDPVITNYNAFGFTGVIIKPYTLMDLKNALKVLSSDPKAGEP
jgi:two-component system cell cycle sensor histidine kinase/response regulator CckA